MEKIYIHKINKEMLLREESEIFRLLPEWRKEKVQKLKVESSRLQSLAAGRLLMIALEKHPDVKYNISHSGDYVAVAVSDLAVGVDVEHKNDDGFKVSNRYFENAAKDYIDGNQSRFRDVWTVKEAFLKCIRVGITVPLNSFTAEYSLDKVLKIRKLVDYRGLDRNFAAKDYYVVTTRLEDGEYSLSLCSSKSNLTLDIERVEVLV